MLKHFFRLIPTFVGGAILFMMQISPDDAISNLFKWINKATLVPIPGWVKAPGIDTVATILAVIMTLSGLIWFFWPQLMLF